MFKGVTSCGINLEHDAGCCLIQNGEVLQATLAERFDRKKYSNNWEIAFKRVLQDTNIRIEDIDLVVLSTGSGFATEGQKIFTDYIDKHKMLSPKKIVTVDHHLSHAYSTYMITPFSSAAIMVVDGAGNIDEKGKSKETFYLAQLMDISLIHENRNKLRGIGKTYDAFTRALGWTQMDAGKTMGLASFGKPGILSGCSLFTTKDLEIEYHFNHVQVSPEIEHSLKSINAVDRDAIGKVIQFLKNHGICFNYGESYNSQLSQDIAYFLQLETERVLIELANSLYKKTQAENLCFSGGVALNCVANKKILEATPFKNIFVCNPVSDKGQCLGNALYGYHHILKNEKRINWKGDFLGKKYSNLEIEGTLNSSPFVKWEKKEPPDLMKETVNVLVKQKIVAWFNGRSELGPRALGNRSILSDPRDAEMKHILNARVKHREAFRPFAVSILENHEKDYFDMDGSSPYMTLAVQSKKMAIEQMPAIVHIDHTSRIQTISKEYSPVYFDLVSSFHDMTGVPAILNTSFNENGEPIVETPNDAVRCFLHTNIDYLIMHDFIVQKNMLYTVFYQHLLHLRRFFLNMIFRLKGILKRRYDYIRY